MVSQGLASLHPQPQALCAGPLIRWLSSRFPDSNMRPSRQARARLIQLTSDLVAQHRAKLRQNSTSMSCCGTCQPVPAQQQHVVQR